MEVGVVAGIVGSIIGLLGGILGTYFGLKGTRSPRERAFVKKVAMLMWIGVTVFLFLMLWLTSPYKYLLWIPYTALLTYVVIGLNRRVSQIRQEEVKS